MQNKGMSEDVARQQVRQEFPGAFGAAVPGVVDGKFPHAMSIEQTPDGPKLKIVVMPRTPAEVSLVAVHYVINDGASMNFDINQPEPGTNTYVHTTPLGGGYPTCPPGSKVSYWLAAVVNGLI